MHKAFRLFLLKQLRVLGRKDAETDKKQKKRTLFWETWSRNKNILFQQNWLWSLCSLSSFMCKRFAYLDIDSGVCIEMEAVL